jgi:hypothetical protein
MKKKILILLFALITAIPCYAQDVMEIPKRDREILIDGFLNEWNGVPAKILAPGEEDIRAGGELTPNDVRLEIQALWDEQYIYLGLHWKDQVWDIEEITRKDAVWMDEDNRRRDRMYFYDNLKFHIRKSDYDFTLWLSPATSEKGPFMWYRLLEGYGGMERATGHPMVSFKESEDGLTAELMLIWQQLKLKGDKGEEYPLTLVVADSDDPDRLLEYKLEHLKWLGWQGMIRLVE